MRRLGSFSASVLVHVALALILIAVPATVSVQPSVRQAVPLTEPFAPRRQAPPLHSRPRVMVPSTVRTLTLPSPATTASPAQASLPELPPPVIPAPAPSAPALPAAPPAAPAPAAVPLRPPAGPPPVRSLPAPRTGVFTTAQPPVSMESERPIAPRGAGFAGPSHATAAGPSAGGVQVGSFGNAGSSPGGAVSQDAPRAVRPTGFADAAVQRAPTPVARNTPRRESQLEILSKPRPAYSDEARRLKIEGEVVLEALFRASGEIRVTRIIHGLGHGLDEMAEQAAAGIRFHPATADGVAVDTVAIVRITFQLAL